VQKNTPPTNDPSLCSYESPEYKARLEQWQTMGDTFRGRLNKAPSPERYLPREANEPADAYPARLIRSPFENHVRKIVTSYAGAIGGAAWDGEMPAAIKAISDDIDMRGSSLEAFIDRTDVIAFRDKYCFVLVDYAATEVENREQEKSYPSQPFWRAIDPRQVINWNEDCGKIERMTIAEMHEEDMGFGCTEEKVYRIIEGDNWRVVRLIETNQIDQNNRKIWREEIIIDTEEDGSTKAKQGQYLQANGQPLGCCPIIPYAITTSDWTDDELPAFIGVADLNIALYQSTSDWRAIVRSLCPVPWIRADNTAKLTNSKGQLSLGPHDYLDLGQTGTNATGYLQSNPGAVQPAYDVVQDLRAAIKQFAIGINDTGSHQVTATQIRTMFLDIKQDLLRYAKQKESVLDNLMKLTAKYLGHSDAVPRAIVTTDISALFTDEKTIALLYKERLLSLESAVNRLNQLGFNEDAAVELLRLSAAPAPGQSTLAGVSAPPQDAQVQPPTP
jgi:hypothetical protein